MFKLNPYGLPVSKEGTQDANMLGREVFNPYECTLIFTSLRANENRTWQVRECLPGRHRFLPHGYYRLQFKCGFTGWKKGPFGLDPKRPADKDGLIAVPLNLGESIGKGLIGEADQLRERFKHECRD